MRLSHTPPGAENKRAACTVKGMLMIYSSSSDLCMFNWVTDRFNLSCEKLQTDVFFSSMLILLCG